MRKNFFHLLDMLITAGSQHYGGWDENLKHITHQGRSFKSPAGFFLVSWPRDVAGIVLSAELALGQSC